jgi:hypothetical protein
MVASVQWLNVRDWIATQLPNSALDERQPLRGRTPLSSQPVGHQNT